MWREYVAGMARAARCAPDVRDGLLSLRRAGWILGVVTNGAVGIQRAKLQRAGLAHAFHGMCISEEVGARKPARALLRTLRHGEAGA
ncbi:HAD family hydrolase [Streptomyces sp. NPDC002402]